MEGKMENKDVWKRKLLKCHNIQVNNETILQDMIPNQQSFNSRWMCWEK